MRPGALLPTLDGAAGRRAARKKNEKQNRVMNAGGIQNRVWHTYAYGETGKVCETRLNLELRRMRPKRRERADGVRMLALQRVELGGCDARLGDRLLDSGGDLEGGGGGARGRGRVS